VIFQLRRVQLVSRKLSYQVCRARRRRRLGKNNEASVEPEPCAGRRILARSNAQGVEIDAVVIGCCTRATCKQQLLPPSSMRDRLESLSRMIFAQGPERPPDSHVTFVVGCVIQARILAPRCAGARMEGHSGAEALEPAGERLHREHQTSITSIVRFRSAMIAICVGLGGLRRNRRIENIEGVELPV